MSSEIRIAAVLISCAVGLSMPRPAAAVVLYSDSTRNGMPGSSSIAYPAWQLEGQFGNYLGTPIASQYFVTAAHTLIGADVNHRLRIIAGQDAPPNLAGGAITFQSQSYNVDASYGFGGVQFDANSDLAVVKIQGTFPAFAQLYTTSDETGKQMVVIGRGTQRGGDVAVNGQTRGWYWGTGDSEQSWGQNTVSGISPQGSGWGDAVAFKFDSSDPTSCTLSGGDSGGGLFIQSGGEWRLAGINFAVDGHYSLTAPPGVNVFDAALFDKSGIWEQTPDWTLNNSSGPIPASAYSTRISSNLAFIESAIPEPGMLGLLVPALGWLLCRRR